MSVVLILTLAAELVAFSIASVTRDVAVLSVYAMELDGPRIAWRTEAAAASPELKLE